MKKVKMNILSKGLRQKMTNIVAITAVEMLIISVICAIILANNTASGALEQTIPAISNSVAEAIVNKINENISFIKIAGEDATIGDTSLEFADKLARLKSISAGSSFDKFLSYGVVNSEGQGGTRSGASYDMTSRDFWLDVKENKTTVSEPLFGKTSQKWSYIFAVPFETSGSFKGATYGSVDLSDISSTLEVAKINDNAEAYVVNDEGKIMISLYNEDIENEINLYDKLESELSKKDLNSLKEAVANDEIITVTKSGDNERVACSDLMIGDTNWHLILFMKESDLTGSLTRNVSIIVVILIILSIVTIVVAGRILNIYLKPFISITNRIESHKEAIMGASNTINASSGTLADDSKNQAASVEEISASIEETTSMIEQSAQGAKNSQTLTEQAKEIASVGNQKMVDMSQTIEDIKKSSDEIGKIINVIDDIASQTNILALNAAVEAARAGDAGKGFAVVAEEVRNLAGKSAEAAKSTQVIIEKNLRFAEQGVTMSKDVAEAIEAISDAINKISVIAAETANAANEEAIGVAQVSDAIKNVEKASVSTAEGAESTSEASRSLDEKARQLDDIVQELKGLING